MLMLETDDPDAIYERAFARGAKVIYPVADRDYGHRGARIADPWGHMWMLWKELPR